MAKVAEVLVQTLIEAGVKRVYGVAGDSLNGMTETIRKSDKIEWLHVRHEEVAAFAAGAEAHLTNEIAVCAGSCGPGNLHLIKLTGYLIAIAVVSLSLQSQHRFRATRSAVGTFRRPIRNTCSRTVATTANWCHSRSRCRASWPSPCERPLANAVSLLW